MGRTSGGTGKMNVRIAPRITRQRDPKDSKKYFRVFTDGACSGNGTPHAKAGIGVHFPKKQLPEISAPFTQPPITNQRAELCAILEALKSILHKNAIVLKGYDGLIIYSDSDYSIKCVVTWAPGWQRKGWKRSGGEPLKNLDLIKPIFNLLHKIPIPAVFVHVRSHTGKTDYRSRHNAEADILATAAVKNLKPGQFCKIKKSQNANRSIEESDEEEKDDDYSEEGYQSILKDRGTTSPKRLSKRQTTKKGPLKRGSIKFSPHKHQRKTTWKSSPRRRGQYTQKRQGTNKSWNSRKGSLRFNGRKRTRKATN
jgi:ribonuclease HI